LREREKEKRSERERERERERCNDVNMLRNKFRRIFADARKKLKYDENANFPQVN
jgi:hypothetical protein